MASGKAKHNLRNFQGRQKVRSGSRRTLPLASFKHTSSIFFFFSLLDPAMHPHSLALPCPHTHLPFPSPPGSSLSLMQRWQQASPGPRPRPQCRRGTGSQPGKDGASGAPARKPVASYRLWSSPPPAEPRCFPPFSRSSLGMIDAGATLLESTDPGASGEGSATGAHSHSVLGDQGAGSWRRRRWRRAGRAEPLQVQKEAGGGRRGRCATLGSRATRVVGARTPAAEKPGALYRQTERGAPRPWHAWHLLCHLLPSH